MSNKGTGRVISSNTKTAYTRWTAPSVQNIEDYKTEKAGLLTASQLEELQKQAYDEGLQSGQNDGYTEGLEKGKQEGLQQGLKEGAEGVAQVIQRFEQMMQLLAEPLQQVDEQVKKELLELSLATARQIIRREITINPEQIVAVVKEAIAVLPSAAKKIKVYLNPDDADIVRQNLNISSPDSSLESKNGQDSVSDEAWSIVEDATLNRGGCHIKTENSKVDASIETRIAEISVKIFGDERADDLDENTVKGSEDKSNKIINTVEEPIQEDVNNPITPQEVHGD